MQLVQEHPETARSLQLWLDVGEDDVWYSSTARLHAALDRSGIGHAWRVYPGGHDGEYWRAHGAEYLRFTRALRPEAAGSGTAQV